MKDSVTGRKIIMIINIKVKTSQKTFRIEKKDNFWVVYVKSKPEKNLANREIIKELSRKYKNVRILKGLKSPKKTINIG